MPFGVIGSTRGFGPRRSGFESQGGSHGFINNILLFVDNCCHVERHLAYNASGSG